jgi:hypothetical protein
MELGVGRGGGGSGAADGAGHGRGLVQQRQQLRDVARGFPPVRRGGASGGPGSRNWKSSSADCPHSERPAGSQSRKARTTVTAYLLEPAATAQQASDAGHVQGKLVLTVD